MEVYYWIAIGLIAAGVALKIAAHFMRKSIKKMKEREKE